MTWKDTLLKEEKKSMRDFIDLVDIVDDMRVSPENEKKFKKVLNKLADMVETYADLAMETSTDFLPADYPNRQREYARQVEQRTRDRAEEDRGRAKKIRDRAKRLGE